MGDVVGFPYGCYANTILDIYPFLPFRFIWHHHPIHAISSPGSDTQPAIVSRSKIHVPHSYALSSSLYTFCVSNTWRSAFYLKISYYWILWGSRFHCDLYSVLEYPSYSSIFEKFCDIRIFWFLVFRGAKPFQFSNIKRPNYSIFVPRCYPCISDLSVFP